MSNKIQQNQEVIFNTVGERVYHSKYGAGRVTSVKESGRGKFVAVQFDNGRTGSFYSDGRSNKKRARNFRNDLQKVY